jgi:hypothetical protein
MQPPDGVFPGGVAACWEGASVDGARVVPDTERPAVTPDLASAADRGGPTAVLGQALVCAPSCLASASGVVYRIEGVAAGDHWRRFQISGFQRQFDFLGVERQYHDDAARVGVPSNDSSFLVVVGLLSEGEQYNSVASLELGVAAHHVRIEGSPLRAQKEAVEPGFTRASLKRT